MGTLKELKTRIQNANALGIANLSEKGVTVSDTATTYDIMKSIGDIESGIESEDFWNIYQQNGNRTNYHYAFGGQGWTDETFKPKYNITVTQGNMLFDSSLITNLKKILNDAGVSLDFSKATSVQYPFRLSTVTDIGILDFSKAGHLNYLFHQCRYLKNVEKVILNANGTQSFNTTYSFGECDVLEHMPVEGAIGRDINLQWSPLDLESAKSIINALVNYSGTANEYVYTVKFSSTTTEYLTADGETSPNSNTWTEYAFDKGWNIE